MKKNLGFTVDRMYDNEGNRIYKDNEKKVFRVIYRSSAGGTGDYLSNKGASSGYLNDIQYSYSQKENAKEDEDNSNNNDDDEDSYRDQNDSEEEDENENESDEDENDNNSDEDDEVRNAKLLENLLNGLSSNYQDEF